ncbi:MAG: hypothetical protein U0361_20245 [Nitrospiraceae bacterium]
MTKMTANVTMVTGCSEKAKVLTNSWTVNGTIREKSPMAMEYETRPSDAAFEAEQQAKVAEHGLKQIAGTARLLLGHRASLG